MKARRARAKQNALVLRAGFGERLRSARRGRALTQAGLARRLGLNPSTIRRYESGTCAPNRLEVFVGLRRELGASLDYLVLGAGSPRLLDPRLARILAATDQLPDDKRDEIVRVLEAVLPPGSTVASPRVRGERPG